MRREGRRLKVEDKGFVKVWGRYSYGERGREGGVKKADKFNSV